MTEFWLGLFQTMAIVGTIAFVAAPFAFAIRNWWRNRK
jgi:hypothetical protein